MRIYDFDTFDYYLPKRARGKKLEVFYGTLTATDWDKDEKPTEFSVYTMDEADILLGSPHLKKKYLKLINRPVEVIGERKTDAFGDEYLCVKKIRRMKYSEFQFLTQRKHAAHVYDFQEFTPLLEQNIFEVIENEYLQITA